MTGSSEHPERALAHADPGVFSPVPVAGHLEWCLERALRYADAGDQDNAYASLMSDLLKYDGPAADMQPYGLHLRLIVAALPEGRPAVELLMRAAGLRPAAADAGGPE